MFFLILIFLPKLTIALARWPILKIVSFVEYLDFSQAVLSTEQLYYDFQSQHEQTAQ